MTRDAPRIRELWPNHPPLEKYIHRDTHASRCKTCHGYKWDGNKLGEGDAQRGLHLPLHKVIADELAAEGVDTTYTPDRAQRVPIHGRVSGVMRVRMIPLPWPPPGDVETT